MWLPNSMCDGFPVDAMQQLLSSTGLMCNLGGRSTANHVPFGGWFCLWIIRPLSLITGAVRVLPIRTLASAGCSLDASEQVSMAHSRPELGVQSLLVTLSMHSSGTAMRTGILDFMGSLQAAGLSGVVSLAGRAWRGGTVVASVQSSSWRGAFIKTEWV